jgi:membrane protease YdiL (CAAX protease family)/uncharacterized protein YndB with AHSA1/START domain
VQQSRRELVILVAVSLVWVMLARVVAQNLLFWMPRSWAGQLTLHTYLSLVNVGVTAVGLALCFTLLKTPRDHLALRRPTFPALAGGLLWAPIAAVLSAYAGFTIALPTLIEEIKRGGRAAAQANTGEFGRALIESDALTTVVWGVVLAPIAEELIFRGALWEAIRRLTAPQAVTSDDDGAASLPSALVERRNGVVFLLRDGGIATLLTTSVFAWMHWDQPGGAGIVRVVQAAGLGLALGTVRQTTRSLWPTVLLHACFNLITLAKVRRWLVSEGWPPPLPIPLWQWSIAAASACLLALWWLHRMSKLRRTDVSASVYVQRPREHVFDVVVAPETIPLVFHGHGPIPGSTHAEMVDDGGMAVGAIRRVTNTDGSVVDEKITGFDPPSHQAYRLVSGVRFPFTLLVEGASGEWRFEQEGDGTQINWTFGFDLTSAFAWPIARLLSRPFGVAMQQALHRVRDLCEADDQTN